MERRKTEELGNVILRFIRQSGLETPLNQHRLVSAWPAVAGEVVGEHTKEIYIRNQTLYVRVDLPTLRADLMMRRKQLALQLNQYVRASVIVDIVLL